MLEATMWCVRHRALHLRYRRFATLMPITVVIGALCLLYLPPLLTPCESVPDHPRDTPTAVPVNQSNVTRLFVSDLSPWQPWVYNTEKCTDQQWLAQEVHLNHSRVLQALRGQHIVMIGDVLAVQRRVIAYSVMFVESAVPDVATGLHTALGRALR
eukprot:PhM_4_TR604/c0_g1_i1/m.26119